MDLRQLKKLWQEHDFHPNKKFGQNFLIDMNVRDNIIKKLALTKETTVVEIGPGFGVMSFALAAECGRLFAVEKDRKICEVMEGFFRKEKNITLICTDMLELDLSSLNAGRKLLVFGNIPYYISTPLIERLINQRQYIENVYIVMQEELANRITSPPGSKQYSSVSCFVQFYTAPKKLFKISRNSFYPKPQVNSCLVKLEMLTKPSVEVGNESLMFKIIHAAFSQRRKKMINPLSKVFKTISKDKWGGLFELSGIKLASRAEDLSLSDYARLADNLTFT